MYPDQLVSILEPSGHSINQTSLVSCLVDREKEMKFKHETAQIYFFLIKDVPNPVHRIDGGTVLYIFIFPEFNGNPCICPC